MTWDEFIKQEGNKDYFKALKTFVKEERATKKIYPKSDEIFNPFRYCPIDKIKVVILGTEPYPVDVNDGLAWSVRGQKISPALANIFKEIKDQDTQVNGYDIDYLFKSNQLISWALDGVLLWNVVVTVEDNKPGSHKDKGWEVFTIEMIKMLNKEKKNIVYMLWGKAAREMVPFIDSQNNLVLLATNPHPKMASRGGWYKNRHFIQCKEYINKHFLNKKVPPLWFILK